MAHREFILEKINNYYPSDPFEITMKLEIIKFIDKNSDCFKRELKIGHITGSAWIVDKNYEYTLLTHHQKLNKWLQLGGHSDGEFNTFNVAMREAKEESGILDFEILNEDIFDIDIHTIPERGDESEHKHYDIRFLFVADKNIPLIITPESKDLKWIQLSEIENYSKNESILRMRNKTLKLFSKS